jgi:uncharacterized membrane protein YgaE (UPF0421/DUF939 family)
VKLVIFHYNEIFKKKIHKKKKINFKFLLKLLDKNEDNKIILQNLYKLKNLNKLENLYKYYKVEKNYFKYKENFNKLNS